VVDELVPVADDDDVALPLEVGDEVAVMVGDARGDLLMLDDGLSDGDRVPCGPFTHVPLINTSAPAEAVAAAGEGVAEFVDVAVELPLPVELAVAVLVRLEDGLMGEERETSGDLDALGERDDDVDNVPAETLTQVSLTKKSPPELAVAVAARDVRAESDLLGLFVRVVSGDLDTLIDPLEVGLREPPVPL
jgi:hypothetical protein